MALAASAGCLVLVLIFFLITIAFGNRLIDIAGLTTDQALDNVLFSSGAGFATLQLLLGLLALISGLTLRSVIALLVLMAIAGGRGWKSAFRLGRKSWKDLSGIFETRAAKALGICSLFFVGLEALISTAPLTGSDAMHYHFTAPLLEIGKPEHPIFWLIHSFFTGLGHELIALGLVLGGDRLALLLIFFCGFLTAAVLFQLSRKMMPVKWALLAVLTFVMTPLVFWQISTAGSPDIWMVFYSLLAVLAMGQVSGTSGRRWLILASVYSGAAASIKYTGWIVPIAVVLIVLWWTKSFLWATGCSIAALVAGGIPGMRNFIWTGDPFFPFWNHWIGRVAANPRGLELLQADVHAQSFSRQPLHIFYFLIMMILKGADYGLGNFFGPIVLAFLPLLFFCNWKSRLAQVVGAVWLSILFANVMTTQMARFLLPAFPLALALVLSGAAMACTRGGKAVRLGCTTTLAVFGLFCIASDTLYAKEFLRVSIGLESKEAFLNRMAPDYQTANFINSALANQKGNVLIFFRHSYYVRVPYINGEPGQSWTMNPDMLTNPQALLSFLKQQDIRWIVKSPDYPMNLASVFEECEKEGMLVPEARTEVEEFFGSSRISSERETVPVTLLRLEK